ncbi:hypothetical protein ASPWEDRAFT_257943 [Aspergillus wentii DTO 134E9]|uniref:Uncharacterized protein n=1 Tax=Aspergillus wentii DTO 134E9 TaxID=1073089 RepID=A0A1L9S2D1_ASPWE|nr:uncharacterized protein ASPWEDRAFT_257943 [Aspergillus wentii DTO 134E9]OJJ41299.1 hypothetical protein ASPWEDRAFT_257943 [Aspergillus wentii DTO 134E9]
MPTGNIGRLSFRFRNHPCLFFFFSDIVLWAVSAGEGGKKKKKSFFESKGLPECSAFANRQTTVCTYIKGLPRCPCQVQGTTRLHDHLSCGCSN